MSQKYSHSLLRISVAQICQNLGWHSAQSSSLEVLTDVLERYILQLGTTCRRYCEHYGRTEVNLDDLGLAFRQMGINLSELEDYVRHVDPVPFAHEVIAFPAPKPSNLGFPNPRSREILQHREEHIPEHLPYMFPNMKDEIAEEKTTVAANGTANGLTKPESAEESNGKEESNVGEKRPASTLTPEMPPSKRPRFGNSCLPEEAGHSQYEMTCVFMGPNGVLTTRQGCQGRKPEPRMPPPNPRSLMEGANKENSGKTKDSGSGGKHSVGGIGADGLAVGKSEGKKKKKSLHKKGLHEHSGKLGLDLAGKELGKKSASSKAAAKFLKKLKLSKKSAKLFAKSKFKDLKLPEHLKDGSSPEKIKKYLLQASLEHSKKKKEKKAAAFDSDEELRNLSSPTSSRGASPEPSVITDGEGAQKKARLEAIDDSINAVLRDSPVKEGKAKGKEKKKAKKDSGAAQGADGKPPEQKVKRKPGRPPKVPKPPEPPPPIDIKPFVSDKYSSEELQVYEFNDSPPDASVKARRPSAAAEPTPLPALSQPPAPQTTGKHETSSHSSSKPTSHRTHKKYELEEELFAPEIKIESRVDTSDSSSAKTSKMDLGKDKHKAKGKDAKMPQHSEEKEKSKSKEEKEDKQKDKREKNKDERDRSHDDKHKDKEHRKDKKDKKKEREKKKKHKEKDRDKEKDKEKKLDTRESRESSPAVGMGVKLKIKIGGSSGPSSMMMSGGSNSPASPASNAGSKRESMSPPRVVPKLYISKKGSGPEDKTGRQHHGGDKSKHKSSPLAVSTKSGSMSPTSNKASPSPRSTPTPPVPHKTPTPPPPPKSSHRDSHSPHIKENYPSRRKNPSPVVGKDRKSRSPIKDKSSQKEKKKRKRSLSSLSSTSSSSLSSLSPTKSSSSHQRRQTPPKLQRMSSSSPEQSPPALPFQSPTSSPRAPSRAARSPSRTSSLHHSPTPPPSLSKRKPTPPPALSPANTRRNRSPSESPTRPPTPGSTSPAASPDWNLPVSPSHDRSPTPTPRTPTASPSRDIPSPSHSSPPGSPVTSRRSPSPEVHHSRPGSRQRGTPDSKQSAKESPSPAASGKSSSSTSKPARTVEAETVCVFYDDSGQKVWICPACKRPDDGSEMIGCDRCDNWYHWPCVGITEAPPEEQQWFCLKCLPKVKTSSSRGRGRPRGRGRGRGRKKIT